MRKERIRERREVPELVSTIDCASRVGQLLEVLQDGYCVVLFDFRHSVLFNKQLASCRASLFYPECASALGGSKKRKLGFASDYVHADVDLSKFFDRVQHDVLMARVSRRVDDKLLLRLIGPYPIIPRLSPPTDGFVKFFEIGAWFGVSLRFGRL